MDAIEHLLIGKADPHARLLLAFHQSNRGFIPRVTAELRLLRDSGQKAAAVRSIFHYLRWTGRWKGVDEFKVCQSLAALAGRICILLWPDVNGMVQLRHARADGVLGTRRGRTLKRYTNRLIAPPGFVMKGTVPDVPELKRPRTAHLRITCAEAAVVIRQVESLVAQAPDPQAPLLREFLAHVLMYPEIFFFMQRTLRARRPGVFSAVSLLEYARWAIRRASATHKTFHLPSKLDGLYSRALVMLNPDFNGRCQFQQDGKNGVANRVLGTKIAEFCVEAEPYRRLLWGAE
jgi:hypothetical protein